MQSEIIEPNAELAKRIGKSRTTLWRWASQGCDLRSHASVQERETNIEKSRRRRAGVGQQAPSSTARASRGAFEYPANGETLPPPGKRGTAHALERLECQEEEAHRRLQAALERGNPIEIQACQDFWLKCSEGQIRQLSDIGQLKLLLQSAAAVTDYAELCGMNPEEFLNAFLEVF